MFLKQLGYEQTDPTPIHIYTFPALRMINDNSSHTEHTGHVEIYYFQLQDYQIDGDIIMAHIKGNLNLSNTETKPLGFVLVIVIV